jgi:hypothetical protein
LLERKLEELGELEELEPVKLELLELELEELELLGLELEELELEELELDELLELEELVELEGDVDAGLATESVVAWGILTVVGRGVIVKMGFPSSSSCATAELVVFGKLLCILALD